MDDVDTSIIDLLQQNGRLKQIAIAEVVGMSVPSISERMRKLETKGIIRGYHAVVDPKKLGYDVTSFVRVIIDRSSYFDGFVRRARKIPEVQEIHSITGDGSHIMKVRARDTSSLEKLLGEISSIPGVQETHTTIVLSTFKETLSIRAKPKAPDADQALEKATPQPG